MLVGKVLFKQYKIVEQIGEGGFGRTYVVIDLAFPGKPHRLLKHLYPLNRDSASLAKAKKLFKTEAIVLSRLGEHDRIPRLFSHFEEDGEFFLVQELIEGRNLTWRNVREATISAKRIKFSHTKNFSIAKMNYHECFTVVLMLLLL